MDKVIQEYLPTNLSHCQSGTCEYSTVPCNLFIFFFPFFLYMHIGSRPTVDHTRRFPSGTQHNRYNQQSTPNSTHIKLRQKADVYSGVNQLVFCILLISNCRDQVEVALWELPFLAVAFLRVITNPVTAKAINTKSTAHAKMSPTTRESASMRVGGGVGGEVGGGVEWR